MEPFNNYLSIRARGKAIPYGGRGEPRPDGGANYGFKNLKTHPDLISQIPEISADESLRKVIVAINKPETGLFSIGCSSLSVEDEKGFRFSGYIEFAINSKPVVGDAQVYFPIFFHFNQSLRKSSFQIPVTFFWELEGASFHEIGVDGFSCSVTINTHYRQERSSAESDWLKSLSALEEFLGSIPQEHPEPLY